jgi:secreted Zn-dependent insulinase-like peptidase
MIGSKESLMPAKSSPTKLQEAVREFHKKNYYAENMRLVVKVGQN